jgi:thiamine pyrophosphokinase
VRVQNTHTKSVRFAHEHFRQSQPELLHRIQRVTKSQDASRIEITSLRDDIAEINDQLASLGSRLDRRLQSLTSAVELDYQQRMTNITLSYQVLSNLAMKNHQSLATSKNNSSCSSSQLMTPPMTMMTTTKPGIHIPESLSPRSAMNPLEALAVVAAMNSAARR